MNHSSRILTFIIFIAVILTSCAGTVEELAPPTPTLIDDPIFFGEVTFKDNECVVDGPEEVARGIYYFTMVDESNTNLKVFINQLLENKTLDDLQDWQEEPGVYLSPPPWIDHPVTTYNFEVEKWVHYLDQVGDYAIVVGDDLMTILWFCEPFSVVEVSAE